MIICEGKMYSYARVSKKDTHGVAHQDFTRQQSLLEGFSARHDFEYAVNFEEKESGTKRNREQLDAMIEVLGEGDIVVIESYTRLSRNLMDMLSIVTEIGEKGAKVYSLNDGGSIDMNSAMGKAMFHIIATFAQLERDLISERVTDTLKAKKEQGIQLGAKSLEEMAVAEDATEEDKAKAEALQKAIQMYQEGAKLKDIREVTGVATMTLNRRLDKLGIPRRRSDAGAKRDSKKVFEIQYGTKPEVVQVQAKNLEDAMQVFRKKYGNHVVTTIKVK